jgi:DNA/RNA endonuclease G (NUC1)
LSINSGNWHLLEDKVHTYSTTQDKNLIVYTGIHGVLELPNSVGVLTEIYLGWTNHVKVPKYFWKIVYDLKKDNG